MFIILFGVTGVGKTTVGLRLAEQLGWKFYDADNFHPPANVEKMSRGIPLTEADRAPWLASLRSRIEQSLREAEDAVLACSALKEAYRLELRVDDRVKLVYL
ncbi:MAG: shikimate kinase, partial [Pyrinomonadaceae bacterium]